MIPQVLSHEVVESLNQLRGQDKGLVLSDDLGTDLIQGFNDIFDLDLQIFFARRKVFPCVDSEHLFLGQGVSFDGRRCPGAFPQGYRQHPFSVFRLDRRRGNGLDDGFALPQHENGFLIKAPIFLKRNMLIILHFIYLYIVFA